MPFLLFFLVLGLAVPGVSVADEPPEPAPVWVPPPSDAPEPVALEDESDLPVWPQFERGRQQVGLLSGYGWGFGIFGSNRKDNEDVRIVPVFGHWGITASNPLGGDSWYRGSFELRVDGFALFNTEPRGGWGAGGGFATRYDFLRARHVVPYVEAGAGMMHIDYDLANQADGFNFALYLGVGVDWPINDHWALNLGYRQHHISNAGTAEPNQGINTGFLLFGPIYFF
jgi:lipid A 3-O-deacylase